jgi:hypothetical protein
VKLPGPRDAGGIPEAERRRLLASTLAGIAAGFSPDVLVVDTFPSGPHLEAAGLLSRVPTRVLVRRAVRPERSSDAEALAGLASYQLALLPADPLAPAETLPGVACVGVPPITLDDGDPEPALSRREARKALGLGDGRCLLVSTGAGGDAGAAEVSSALARSAESCGWTPWIAGLPELLPGSTAPPLLARYLPAFDAAVAAAGYNTAHELALAGVPSLLFARPRPYDDQDARARRFEEAGLALRLPSLEAAGLPAALERLRGFRPRPLAGGGAAACARLILALLGRAPQPAVSAALPERSA